MEKRAKDVQTRGFDLANNPQVPSVMTTFPGEDAQKKERVKMQQSQQQDWLSQQMAMLRDKEARERQEEAEYAAMQRDITAMKKQVEQERDYVRTKTLIQTKDANMFMSNEKRNRQRDEQARNEAKSQDELKATLTSGLMTESVPQSLLGPNRIVPYAYKGMTVDQRQRILDEQAKQMMEAKMRKEMEEEDERLEAQRAEEVRRMLVKAARDKAAQDRQARLTLKEEQQLQKREKDMRSQHLDRSVYQNPVDESYFDQFGKSCR